MKNCADSPDAGAYQITSVLTTLKTVITSSKSSDDSGSSTESNTYYPVPTGMNVASPPQPDERDVFEADANHPWGGESPQHRHHNAEELQGDRPGTSWVEAVRKLGSLWRE